MSFQYSIFKIIISTLIPICFLLMQLSFVIKINKILLNFNREKYSIIPFLTLLINCFTWFLYGIMTNEISVYISNMIGLIIGCIGTIVYHEYSIYPPLIFYYVITFFFLFFNLLLYALHWHDFLGTMAMIFAIILYGSPLSTVYVVMQERSTESISFPLTLTSCFSAIMWLIYGIYVVQDVWITIPSIIGIILTSIQLFLFFMYGLNPNETVASSVHHLYR